MGTHRCDPPARQLLFRFERGSFCYCGKTTVVFNVDVLVNVLCECGEMKLAVLTKHVITPTDVSEMSLPKLMRILKSTS